MVKDNQIACKGDAVDKFNLDYSRLYGKSIPITCWSEIDYKVALYANLTPLGQQIRNSGGSTYLVSTISHISMGLEK